MSAFDLKSESEVKEYLNNLGIEYRFGCYSEKKPEGKTTSFLQPHLRFFSNYFCRSLPFVGRFFGCRQKGF